MKWQNAFFFNRVIFQDGFISCSVHKACVFTASEANQMLLMKYQLFLCAEYGIEFIEHGKKGFTCLEGN